GRERRHDDARRRGDDLVPRRTSRDDACVVRAAVVPVAGAAVDDGHGCGRRRGEHGADGDGRANACGHAPGLIALVVVADDHPVTAYRGIPFFSRDDRSAWARPGVPVLAVCDGAVAADRGIALVSRGDGTVAPGSRVSFLALDRDTPR